MLGIYFFTSLYLQSNLAFSPSKAGLAFVPMALCLALAAALSPRVVTLIGGHRTVALGMAIMTVGLVLFAGLGAGATFTSLLPGFVLFGLGAGLMNVPLTNAVIDGAPAAQAGVASALLNASREVAGLLGVTVIGAVLRSSRGQRAALGREPGAGVHRRLPLRPVADDRPARRRGRAQLPVPAAPAAVGLESAAAALGAMEQEEPVSAVVADAAPSAVPPPGSRARQAATTWRPHLFPIRNGCGLLRFASRITSALPAALAAHSIIGYACLTGVSGMRSHSAERRRDGLRRRGRRRAVVLRAAPQPAQRHQRGKRHDRGHRVQHVLCGGGEAAG